VADEGLQPGGRWEARLSDRGQGRDHAPGVPRSRPNRDGAGGAEGHRRRPGCGVARRPGGADPVSDRAGRALHRRDQPGGLLGIHGDWRGQGFGGRHDHRARHTIGARRPVHSARRYPAGRYGHDRDREAAAALQRGDAVPADRARTVEGLLSLQLRPAPVPVRDPGADGSVRGCYRFGPHSAAALQVQRHPEAHEAAVGRSPAHQLLRLHGDG